VQGNVCLASGGLAEEIERLRAEPAEPAEGDIAIGGATLAAEAGALGLIDEYRARVYPVLVGGGIPFCSRSERSSDLGSSAICTARRRRPSRICRWIVSITPQQQGKRCRLRHFSLCGTGPRDGTVRLDWRVHGAWCLGVMDRLAGGYLKGPATGRQLFN